MIRPYEVQDTKVVLDVWFEASSLAHPFLSDDFIQQERINTRDIYLPNTNTWLYWKNDQPEGFISMIKNEVGAIFVKPNSHGKAIGTKSLDMMAGNHQELEVEVFEKNEIGRAFYKKYGFTLMNRHLYEATGNYLLQLKYTKS
ncbi:MAG: GNAT family N-acetyltransferase [Bacteroidetes bacterium]|nr:GNAT family N-acetyltransferase [Bacteroidota bacterium]